MCWSGTALGSSAGWLASLAAGLRSAEATGQGSPHSCHKQVATYAPIATYNRAEAALLENLQTLRIVVIRLGKLGSPLAAGIATEGGTALGSHKNRQPVS